MFRAVAARQFKRRLCELLLPHVVVALARGEELDPLLTAFLELDTPEVWRVPVSRRRSAQNPRGAGDPPGGPISRRFGRSRAAEVFLDSVPC